MQLIIIVVAWLLYLYVKKIPEQVHSKNLESFKSELQKEVEKLKVSEGNLHIRKIEKYSQFVDMLNIAMLSVKENKTPQETAKALEKAMNKFTKDIMFFAGEGTLKRFVEYRIYSQIVQHGGDNEMAKYQFVIAELILEMRKDLGYTNKGITVDDYMYITVNDWGKHKDNYHALAEQAIRLNE